MSVIEQRADDLFQLEALFMGQAGLLELETIPERFQHDALNEGYFAKTPQRISLPCPQVFTPSP
jgi:hypothetical protein